MKLMAIVHELTYFDEILKSIKDKFRNFESVSKPLEYVNDLIEIVKKKNDNDDRDISFDTTFLDEHFEKCLNARGEAILPHLLELAKYFIGVIKSKHKNISIEADLIDDEEEGIVIEMDENDTEASTQVLAAETDIGSVLSEQTDIEVKITPEEMVNSHPMVVVTPQVESTPKTSVKVGRVVLTKVEPVAVGASNGFVGSDNESARKEDDSEVMSTEENGVGNGDEKNGGGEEEEGEEEEDDGEERDEDNLTRYDRKVLDKMNKYDDFIMKVKDRIEVFDRVEMTLDELEEGSNSIKSNILKGRCEKAVQKLRKLCKENPHLVEGEIPKKEANQFKKIIINASKYPEVNAKLTSRLKKSKAFPDYEDVTKWIAVTNAESNLSMSKEIVEEEAKKVFTEVCAILKARRKKETEAIFKTYMTDEANETADYEQMSKDEEVKKRLEQNKKRAEEQKAAILLESERNEVAMDGGDGDTIASESDEEEDDDSEDDEEGSTKKSNDSGSQAEGDEEDAEKKSSVSSDDDYASFDEDDEDKAEELPTTNNETTKQNSESKDRSNPLAPSESNEVAEPTATTSTTPTTSTISATISLKTEPINTTPPNLDRPKLSSKRSVDSDDNKDSEEVAATLGTPIKKAKTEPTQPTQQPHFGLNGNSLGIRLISAGSSNTNIKASEAVSDTVEVSDKEDYRISMDKEVEEDDCIVLD